MFHVVIVVCSCRECVLVSVGVTLTFFHMKEKMLYDGNMLWGNVKATQPTFIPGADECCLYCRTTQVFRLEQNGRRFCTNEECKWMQPMNFVCHTCQNPNLSSLCFFGTPEAVAEHVFDKKGLIYCDYECMQKSFLDVIVKVAYASNRKCRHYHKKAVSWDTTFHQLLNSVNAEEEYLADLTTTFCFVKGFKHPYMSPIARSQVIDLKTTLRQAYEPGIYLVHKNWLEQEFQDIAELVESLEQDQAQAQPVDQDQAKPVDRDLVIDKLPVSRRRKKNTVTRKMPEELDLVVENDSDEEEFLAVRTKGKKRGQPKDERSLKTFAGLPAVELAKMLDWTKIQVIPIDKSPLPMRWVMGEYTVAHPDFGKQTKRLNSKELFDHVLLQMSGLSGIWYYKNQSGGGEDINKQQRFPHSDIDNKTGERKEAQTVLRSKKPRSGKGYKRVDYLDGKEQTNHNLCSLWFTDEEAEDFVKGFTLEEANFILCPYVYLSDEARKLFPGASYWRLVVLPFCLLDEKKFPRWMSLLDRKLEHGSAYSPQFLQNVSIVMKEAKLVHEQVPKKLKTVEEEPVPSADTGLAYESDVPPFGTQGQVLLESSALLLNEFEDI